jgi:NAD(P)-dependent dehydrogenase (short-subunit alcohol dehydrogenase family)
MRRFVERVALVTGGGGAIGAAAAERLSNEGARLVVVDVDAGRADTTATTLRRAGGEAVAVEADVGDPADVAAAFELALSHFGRLDVVFNNAGIPGIPAPIHDLDVADFDEVLRVNLRGVFLVLRASVRAMIASGRGGAVVNMASSMAGWDVLAGGSAYAASKHGVLGLTRTAALEAAQYGIRVNAVCPGVVETPLGIPDLGEGPGGRDRFANRIPLRRVGTPADVAGVVAFLASSDARYVTGAGWLIDGGQTLQSWSNAPPADRFPLVVDGEQTTPTQSHGGPHDEYVN